MCMYMLEKIHLLNKINLPKKNFIEIGAGAGRTATVILSINENAKYVIADLPPAIEVSYKNLKACFPNKKIFKCFSVNDSN